MLCVTAVFCCLLSFMTRSFLSRDSCDIFRGDLRVCWDSCACYDHILLYRNRVCLWTDFVWENVYHERSRWDGDDGYYTSVHSADIPGDWEGLSVVFILLMLLLWNDSCLMTYLAISSVCVKNYIWYYCCCCCSFAFYRLFVISKTCVLLFLVSIIVIIIIVIIVCYFCVQISTFAVCICRRVAIFVCTIIYCALVTYERVMFC